MEPSVSRRLLEYNPILETVDGAFAEQEAPMDGSVFGESDEMALASELLEVQDEAALDRYLRRLVSRAAILGARPAAPQVAPMLVVELRRVIWPMFAGHRTRAAGLVARRTQDPVVQAARLFGLELEGLSPEDQEFALAQQVVRFAGNAANQVASPAASRGNPRVQARQAVERAARQHAPGLLPRMKQPALEGTWRRVGGQIVVFVS